MRMNVLVNREVKFSGIEEKCIDWMIQRYGSFFFRGIDKLHRFAAPHPFEGTFDDVVVKIIYKENEKYKDILKRLEERCGCRASFSLLNFNGRPVFIRELIESEKENFCAVCQCNAMMAVYDPTVKGNDGLWYYCGVCEACN